MTSPYQWSPTVCLNTKKIAPMFDIIKIPTTLPLKRKMPTSNGGQQMTSQTPHRGRSSPYDAGSSSSRMRRREQGCSDTCRPAEQRQVTTVHKVNVAKNRHSYACDADKENTPSRALKFKHRLAVSTACASKRGNVMTHCDIVSADQPASAAKVASKRQHHHLGDLSAVYRRSAAGLREQVSSSFIAQWAGLDQVEYNNNENNSNNNTAAWDCSNNVNNVPLHSTFDYPLHSTIIDSHVTRIGIGDEGDTHGDTGDTMPLARQLTSLRHSLGTSSLAAMCKNSSSKDNRCASDMSHRFVYARRDDYAHKFAFPKHLPASEMELLAASEDSSCGSSDSSFVTVSVECPSEMQPSACNYGSYGNCGWVDQGQLGPDGCYCHSHVTLPASHHPHPHPVYWPRPRHVTSNDTDSTVSTETLSLSQYRQLLDFNNYNYGISKGHGQRGHYKTGYVRSFVGTPEYGTESRGHRIQRKHSAKRVTNCFPVKCTSSNRR